MGYFLRISQLIMAMKNVRQSANKALKDTSILYWISILLNSFQNDFLQKPWDWECCCEAVRKDKKLWDSRQNSESWQVWCIN